MPEMVAGVEGVIFHFNSSFVFSGTSTISHVSQRLLERLSFSPLLLGALCNGQEELFWKKQLKELQTDGKLATIQPLHSPEASIAAALQAIALAGKWHLPPASTAVVMGSSHAEEMQQVAAQGWRVVHLSDSTDSSVAEPAAWAAVDSLLDVPAVIAEAAKQANEEGRVVVVGHCMKWSRERDFLQRGAFPLLPTAEGLCFVPIDLDRPLDRQIAPVDVLLHKATDEILRVDEGASGTVGSRVKFSEGLYSLERYLAEHPEVCVVDPLPAIMPLLDRAAMQEVLQGLPAVPSPGTCNVRPPRSAQVSSFDRPTVRRALEEGKVILPAIVKPLIACGASESHTMAVVFREEGFEDLQVPLPATIQEYVDHGAWQHKCYLLGASLFTVPRKSTPDAASAMATHGKEGGAGSPPPAARVFDSLRSLPTTFTMEDSSSTGAPGPTQSLRVPEVEALDLDRQAVAKAGDWLRQKLELTFLGFDIVVQKGTRDHVVIDVNYFPSFKDVADAEAIPALWDALLKAFRRHAVRG